MGPRQQRVFYLQQPLAACNSLLLESTTLPFNESSVCADLGKWRARVRPCSLCTLWCRPPLSHGPGLPGDSSTRIHGNRWCYTAACTERSSLTGTGPHPRPSTSFLGWRHTHTHRITFQLSLPLSSTVLRTVWIGYLNLTQKTCQKSVE